MNYGAFRLVLIAGLLTLGTTAAEVTGAVRIYNVAGVPSEIFDVAMKTVEAIYARAGLEIQWVPPNGSQNSIESAFVLRILPGGSRLPQSPLALGAAYFLKTSQTPLGADVFYGAIQERSRTPTEIAMLLANVAAHEVAHLLLGRSHAASGMMSAQWARAKIEAATRRPLLFSRAEGKLLRASLAKRHTNHLAKSGLANFNSPIEDGSSPREKPEK